MHRFTLSTELCFGPKALERLKEWTGKRILLVTDPYFVQNGTAERILSLCKGESRIFDQVEPDPCVALVAQGVQIMDSFQPDALIALGGGSSIDCAKGMLALGKSRACFIAIPTTSGTGSEVTSFSILTHEGVKQVLVEERLRPKVAILDDSLLSQLPPSLIADAGMDVICHCLEAVAAKNASPFSTALAGHAFLTALKLLPASFEGDKSLRGQIHCAATMAGIAFDHAGLGACHALSHALGGVFHLPHGRLNGILLPHVLEFNLQGCPEPYADLARLCGLSSARGLIFALRKLRKQLKLPETLSQAGLERGQVTKKMQELCETAMADPCTKTNPRRLTESDFAALLRRAL